jgi:hypothetical protein
MNTALLIIVIAAHVQSIKTLASFFKINPQAIEPKQLCAVIYKLPSKKSVHFQI